MIMSQRATRARSSIDRVTSFFSRIQAVAHDPEALDFTFGNPHEMALAGLTDAMRAQIEPRSVDWYAYKSNERSAQEAVADGLLRDLGMEFGAEDIALTQGAFAPRTRWAAARSAASALDEVIRMAATIAMPRARAQRTRTPARGVDPTGAPARDPRRTLDSAEQHRHRRLPTCRHRRAGDAERTREHDSASATGRSTTKPTLAPHPEIPLTGPLLREARDEDHGDADPRGHRGDHRSQPGGRFLHRGEPRHEQSQESTAGELPRSDERVEIGLPG